VTGTQQSGCPGQNIDGLILAPTDGSPHPWNFTPRSKRARKLAPSSEAPLASTAYRPASVTIAIRPAEGRDGQPYVTDLSEARSGKSPDMFGRYAEVREGRETKPEAVGPAPKPAFLKYTGKSAAGGKRRARPVRP
jgi:hypothetical protein